MNDDSPPESRRPPAGGEFTWPPTSDELDAIQVIPLDGTSSAAPIAAKATDLMPPPRDRVLPAPVIASATLVAPVAKRSSRLRMPHIPRVPRRDDLVLAGVTLTSVLAIGTAAFMQFSDAPRTPVEPADLAPPPLAATAPLGATSLPLMSPSMSQVMSEVIAGAPIAVAAAPAAAFDKAGVTPRPRSVARTHTRTRARGLASKGFASSRGYASAGHASRAAEHRRVIPISEDFARPRLITPEQGRSGKLVLLVEVRKNGKVGDVDVLSSDLDRSNRSHRDLQRAAVSAVKRWRYTPAIRDGEPTASQIRVVVDINLDSSRVAFTEANARRRAAAADRATDTVLAAR
jgi:TonB family protein